MSNQELPLSMKNDASSLSRACHSAPPVSARCRLDRHLDLQLEALFHRRRVGIGHDLIGGEAGKQQNLPDALAAELEQEHVEKRLIADLEQGLRRVRGQRPKPGAETAAENGCLSDHSLTLSAGKLAIQHRTSAVIKDLAPSSNCVPRCSSVSNIYVQGR